MATVTPKDVTTPHANGSTPVTEAIEVTTTEIQQAAAKAGDTLFVWLRKLPLASLGLVGLIGDETKVVVNNLFMGKLVERGELVRKDAEQWMHDVQARFR